MSKERDYSKGEDGLLANCFLGKFDFYLLLEPQYSYGKLDKASKPYISVCSLYSLFSESPALGLSYRKGNYSQMCLKVSRSSVF